MFFWAWNLLELIRKVILDVSVNFSLFDGILYESMSFWFFNIDLLPMTYPIMFLFFEFVCWFFIGGNCLDDGEKENCFQI